MNARFWAWINEGWVKLTLRPGQTINRGEGGRTSEGHWGRGVTWEHDGAAVRRSVTEMGADCDGRYESYEDCSCALHLLSANRNNDGPELPAWEWVDCSQRDYTAEAAGY